MESKAIESAIKRTFEELPPALQYKESIYQKVLEHYLHKSLPCAVVSKEVTVAYKTSDHFVYAYGRMDLVIETNDSYIILELKANINFKTKFKACVAQLSRYMVHAVSDKPVSGILIIFGSHDPIVRYAKLTTEKTITMSISFSK